MAVDRIPVTVHGGRAGPEGHENAGETVAYTLTAGTSAAIVGTIVDVTCTTDAYVAIGSSVAATSSGYFCAAGQTYRFPITSGNTVSAIQVSAGGNLHVHPVS